MSTRKKWWTRQRGTAGFLRWPSKTAAYDHVIDRRDSWRPDAGDAATLYVYVDEGNGRELYETVDLAAGPAVDPEEWWSNPASKHHAPAPAEPAAPEHATESDDGGRRT